MTDSVTGTAPERQAVRQAAFGENTVPGAYLGG